MHFFALLIDERCCTLELQHWNSKPTHFACCFCYLYTPFKNSPIYILITLSKKSPHCIKHLLIKILRIEVVHLLQYNILNGSFDTYQRNNLGVLLHCKVHFTTDFIACFYLEKITHLNQFLKKCISIYEKNGKI